MNPRRDADATGAITGRLRWGSLARRSVLALAIGAGVLGSAAAASFDLPPLVQPASAEHHAGKLIWAELATSDLDATRRFYGGLFGWTFRDIATAQHDYAVAFLGDRPVAGLVLRTTPAGQHRQPVWLSFISVRNVDAVARSARSHGAKVVFNPTSYPQRGRQAVLSDPEGAAFAILASSSGDPPDLLAEPGEWIWGSLQVRDPATDAAFYQAIVGYEVYDVPSEDGLRHAILSSDGFARVSVNALPNDSAPRHPHWLNFVRVVDAASIAARAMTLGGRVLVEPHPDRHGGALAVLADPAGAPFGVMEWPDANNTGEQE